MTRQEFVDLYCANSGITESEFDDLLVALPCYCNDADCTGWITIPAQNKAAKSTAHEVYD